MMSSYRKVFVYFLILSLLDYKDLSMYIFCSTWSFIDASIQEATQVEQNWMVYLALTEPSFLLCDLCFF